MRRSSETARRCSRTAGSARAAEESACSFWGSQPSRAATASERELGAEQRRRQPGDRRELVVGREHQQAVALEVVELGRVAAEVVVVQDARIRAHDDAQARQAQPPAEVGVLAVQEHGLPESTDLAEALRGHEQARARADRDLRRRPGRRHVAVRGPGEAEVVQPVARGVDGAVGVQDDGLRRADAGVVVGAAARARRASPAPARSRS